MALKHNPFPLIFTRGSDSTKLTCLDFFGLTNSPQAHACLLTLLRRQRSDGAFPSWHDPAKRGTRETVRGGLLLLKVGMPPQGVNAASAVRLLLSCQRADGGWSEAP